MSILDMLMLNGDVNSYLAKMSIVAFCVITIYSEKKQGVFIFDG